MTDGLQLIRRNLKAKADKKYRDGSFRYFKETIKPYGVPVPVARETAKEYLRECKPDYEQALPISEQLLKDGWFEEGIAAFTIMDRFKKQFDETTFRVFERWVDRYVKNWAHCDFLSSDLIGACIENKPGLARKLVKWTASKNRWKRRSAAVSLVVHARRGRLVKEVLAVSERLMTDEDDMVQKGVGWLLKELSKAERLVVVSFLKKWIGKAKPLVIRYANEKMKYKFKQ